MAGSRIASGNSLLHAEFRIFWVCGCLQPAPPAAPASAGASGAMTSRCVHPLPCSALPWLDRTLMGHP